MDAKDLRTESSLGEHSDDGRNKYAHNSNAIQCDRNKPYQDNGSNSLVKVDVPIARPCAVIGPDRIVTTSITNDGYSKNGDQWSNLDSYYRHSEYHHKLPDCQNQTRNISPRQTFQENMQRIMVPPRYNNLKSNDETNFPVERSIAQSKFQKFNVPLEGKYGEVPYNVNPVTNEHKSVPNTDVYVTNPAVLRNSGWTTTSANVRQSRPYVPPESYQYPDYGNCAGSKSVPGSRNQKTIHDENGHVYADPYYHAGNIHFKPYPVKERYSQTRYDFIGNYSNPYHQPPPFHSHKYDLQKTLPHHPYPAHPQVPLKYLENRLTEPIIENYQRTSNPQPNYNVQLRNPVIHAPFGPAPGNSSHSKGYPYPPDISIKSIPSNKLPYDQNKMYMEYDNMRNKQYQMSENFYPNEISRSFPIRGAMPPSYPPISVHSLHSHPYYRKDMRNDFFPHFKNMDSTITNNLSRIPSQFSPSGLPISPDSNTSNDTTHLQGNLQDDCGYVSQSSSTSIRSMDSSVSRVPNDFYRRYDFRYGPLVNSLPKYSKPEMNTHSNEKKDIDVRQFLQMWNDEGDEETSENNINKEKVSQTHSNTIKQNEVNSQEQLYVLGLVNVPREELGKYEHIQKVSKLPENIKGYNNIELLNQFEEAIESSNMVNFNIKTTKSREVYSALKTPISAQQNEITRPLSPLDVEAKISQSVIHKEVGCNFEIKPCSPKMLNVELAAPVKNIIAERIIEKVTNPITVRPPMIISSVNETNNNAKATQMQDPTLLFNENLKIPSCKMIDTQFLSMDRTEEGKSNYSLQDLESNSGVCLASLPRLDNDIELNFPEVNQQFINANKIESELDITYTKDISSPNIELNKIMGKEIKVVQESQSFNGDTEKEFVKLSKYRKNKSSVLECKPSSPKICNQILRTDSVIIKNPENKQVEENYQIFENKVSQESQQNPINLTMQIDDTLKYIDNKVKNKSAAINYTMNSNVNANKELMTKGINDSLFIGEVFVQTNNDDFRLINKEQLKLEQAAVNNSSKIDGNDRIIHGKGDPECNSDKDIIKSNSTCTNRLQEKKEEKDCANVDEEGKCNIVNTSSNILSSSDEKVNDFNIDPKTFPLQCNSFHIQSENKYSEFDSLSAVTKIVADNKDDVQEKVKIVTNTGANSTLTNPLLHKQKNDSYQEQTENIDLSCEKDNTSNENLNDTNSILTNPLQDNTNGDCCIQEQKETIDFSCEKRNTRHENLYESANVNEVTMDFKISNDDLDQTLHVDHNQDTVHPSLELKKPNMATNDEELQSLQNFTNTEIILDPEQTKDSTITVDSYKSQTQTCLDLKLQECSKTKKKLNPILLEKVNVKGITVVEEKQIDLKLNECSTINSISESALPEEVNINQNTNFIETCTNYTMQESTTKTQSVSNLIEVGINTVNENINHCLKNTDFLSYSKIKTDVLVEIIPTYQDTDMSTSKNNEIHKPQESLRNSLTVAELVPTVDVTSAKNDSNCTDSIVTEKLLDLEAQECLHTTISPNDTCLMYENLNNIIDNQEITQENKRKNQSIENLSNVTKFGVKDNTERSSICFLDNKPCQTLSKPSSCQPENMEMDVPTVKSNPFHVNKELFSPTIQKLVIHTEGPCPLYNCNTFSGAIIDKNALKNLVQQTKESQLEPKYINKHATIAQTNTEISNQVVTIKNIESQSLANNMKEIFHKADIGSTIDFDHQDHDENLTVQNNESKFSNKTENNLLSINKTSVKSLKEIAMKVLLPKSFIHETHDFDGTYNKSKNPNEHKLAVYSSDAKELNKINTENSVHDVKLNEVIIKKDLETNNYSNTNRGYLKKKKALKRSFSDTELNLYNNESYDGSKQNSPEDIWPNKHRKILKDLTDSRILHENICNIIQTNRRNSVSGIYNEENISFCILIDDNCIITEENDETEKICFTQIDNNEPINDDINEDSIKIISCLNNVGCEFPNSMILDCSGDKQLEETWVQDVACETIVSDDIAEDITINIPSSPKNSDLSGNSNNGEPTIFNSNINEHTEKVKYIYGDKMHTDDAQLVERLFRTPQMDVNKTLVDIESHIMDGDKYYDKDSLVQILSGSNSHESSELDLNMIEKHTYFKDYAIKSTIDQSENLEMADANGNIEVLKPEVHDASLLQNNYSVNTEDAKAQKDRANIGPSHIYKNNEFENQQKEESAKYSSSSPEVSSTTPEEKNLSIKYHMTNYGHSNYTQFKNIDVFNKNNNSCRFKQENNYLQNNIPTVRPLITKGAQKYIPPIKETIPNLKVKLPLPKNSLKKLQQLKILKDEPKSAIKLTLNTKSSTITKTEIYKPKKPKFEDVLKSIDEIQIKMHKEKHKKHRKSIPKVVIKKNENGSHYASTSKHDSYNPDLTGRKWQPWVFLEKNNFLDKMVLKKKTTAIYSHRKKAYVLAENIPKYMSSSIAKFVIAQPKSENCNGQLKCTIRLKHSQ